MFKKTISPRISETNAARHIGHNAIPVWLEEGFIEVLKLFVQDPAQDPAVAMANLNIDFLGEIFFGTDVELTTAVKKIGKSSTVLHQEIFQKGRLCVRAAVTFVNFDFQTKQTKPIPGETVRKLRDHLLDDSAAAQA
jgi:acyl-CoA thioester hydrolase